MKKAILILCIIVLPAISQSTILNDIPEDANVFEITFKDGKGPRNETVAYAAIKVDHEFLTGDYRPAEGDTGKSLEIVYDSPSNPGEEKVFPTNIVGALPERDRDRKARYKEEGYDFVSGSGDVQMLVHDTTIARVERLTELENERSDRRAERVAQNELALEGNNSTSQSAGLVALWGRHILTIVVAGLLLFGVAKTCF